MKQRSGQGVLERLARVATIALLVAVAGCTDDETSSEGDVLLDASEVEAAEADSGTDLLTQAVKGCDTVDGAYLWGDAADGDVRSFTREVDGGTQTTVIGAWPTPEETWVEAETHMTYDGGDCVPEGVSVQGEALGGVSDSYPNWGLSASEVTHRGEGSAPKSYAVRAYGYTQGHVVIVWVEQPGGKPDTDRVVELLNKQADKIADTS
ncbi:MAG: hypothetical protein L0H93_16810 [Nocardioides sp.]|nr:hypothetical protein [Nocardioides sp.]